MNMKKKSCMLYDSAFELPMSFLLLESLLRIVNPTSNCPDEPLPTPRGLALHGEVQKPMVRLPVIFGRSNISMMVPCRLYHFLYGFLLKYLLKLLSMIVACLCSYIFFVFNF